MKPFLLLSVGMVCAGSGVPEPCSGKARCLCIFIFADRTGHVPNRIDLFFWLKNPQKYCNIEWQPYCQLRACGTSTATAALQRPHQLSFRVYTAFNVLFLFHLFSIHTLRWGLQNEMSRPTLRAGMRPAVLWTRLRRISLRCKVHRRRLRSELHRGGVVNLILPAPFPPLPPFFLLFFGDVKLI